MMRDKYWVFAGTALLVALVAGISARAGSAPLGVAFATFLTAAVVFLVLAAIDFAPEDGVPVNPPDTRLKGLAPGLGRALIEQMPTALVLIERGGKIAYANPPARELVPRLAPGGHFANLFRAPGFVEMVTQTLSDGEYREVEFTLKGSMQHFEARIGRLPAELDPVASGQVIVQIEDRTQARLSDEMRRDFIANASHELRTPLASILGYIETLKGHAKDDAEAREQFLGIMESQASRMQRLVDDLMSLSRIELKEHVRPQEPCELYGIVRDTLDALRPTAEKAGVSLIDNLPKEDVTLPGDRDELLQVMHNLIDNAIKYSGRGTSVSLDEAKPSRRFPGLVGLSITDTGPGIARENMLRLTERFYRVSVLQSRNKGGTGLGLAIVKHIINRHGGELQIESELGEGSTFTIWLPTEFIQSDDLEEFPFETVG